MKKINYRGVLSCVRAGAATMALLNASGDAAFASDELVSFNFSGSTYYHETSDIPGTKWWSGNNTLYNNTGQPVWLGVIGITANYVVSGGVTNYTSRGEYAAFCGEIAQMLDGPTTFIHTNKPLGNMTMLTAGTGASYGIDIGGIGTQKARLVNMLFDLRYAGRRANDDWNSDTAAAFQLALWEFTHESLGTGAWTLFDSSPSATFHNYGFDPLDSRLVLGEQYIQEVVAYNAAHQDDYMPTLQLVGLINEEYQDIIVPLSAIPEPRWLLAPGLAAVLFLFRRRRN